MMEDREMKKPINWPRKGIMETLLTRLLESPLLWANEVIRRHLRQENQNRWKTCKGCRQSETLMSGPVSSRTKGPQAMSRQKLRVAVGLLTGHTTVTAHMFKLGLTQKQDYLLCEDERKTVYILYITVRHWHAKDTETCAVCSWRPRV